MHRLQLAVAVLAGVGFASWVAIVLAIVQLYEQVLTDQAHICALAQSLWATQMFITAKLGLPPPGVMPSCQ